VLHGRIRTFAFVVSTLAWGGAIAIGLFVFGKYDAAPAPAGEPPSRWPSGSAIARPQTRPALLLFAHPQCPCTRASLDELIALMTHTRGLASVYVVFSAPPTASESWTHSSSWNYAASIPDVRVVLDKDSREAERFGVLASGHVLLYGTDGTLRFGGGITPARGRVGDNAGRAALAALQTGQRPARTRTPLFGCLLPTPSHAGAGNARHARTS
jgi:hypothetical protein